MALPPFSFTSFSPLPPPPPPPPLSETAKQPPPPPEPESAPPAPQKPILAPVDESSANHPILVQTNPPAPQNPVIFPTPPPTSVPETTTTQNVTVVTVPLAAPTRAPRTRRWTTLGAGFGLAAGLAAGAYHHSRQPAEFESVARIQVTGPAEARDVKTQVSILRSQPVLDRAARGLDDLRPFEVPPPKAEPARVAFLGQGLSAVGTSPAADPGSTLTLTFRGQHPTDTAKYLYAVIASYRSELAKRPVPSPALAPPPKPKPESSGQPVPADGAKFDAERQRLTDELRTLTTEDVSAVETRLAASRKDAEQVRAKQKGVDRDLALIRETGPARQDRLATMKQLGLEPDRPTPTPAPSPETNGAEEWLRTLELRKAELGERLGPEHRDMLALDEQIKLVKERIAKATPKVVPAGPDAIERYRVDLEAERAALAARSGVLAAAIAHDEKLVGETARIRQRLRELADARKDHETRSQAKGPEPKAAPVPQPTAAYAVQTVSPPTDGERVSPLLYRSLVPGGLLGLLVGGVLGFLASLVATRISGQPRPSKPTPPPSVRTPRPLKVTRTPAEPGPKLGVPVFAQVPQIRADVPAEKKSADGLSPMLVCFYRPTGPESETFRTARRELAAALGNRGHQVIAVTSPGPGDGKTTVAANLAISLAQSGKRVILVDCDFRNAKVQEMFRLNRLGDSLKSVMAADVDLRMAVRACEVANLFLLPAGRGPVDPVDLLTRPKFRELLAELRGSYEFVIVDAPSTIEERELAPIVEPADGTVMVIRAGAEIVSRSDRARGQVMEVRGCVIGAVVNAAPTASAVGQPTAVPPPEPAVPVTSETNQG